MAIQAMHEDFATWYSNVDLGESADRLNNRWEGLSALLEGAEYEHVKFLLDVFMRQDGAFAGEAGEYMRPTFTAVDQYFPKSNNDDEMAMLAEAGIAIILENESWLAGATATLVISALHGGAVKSKGFTDLLARAEHVLRSLGEAVRKRDTLKKPPKTYAPTINIDDDFGEMVDFNDFALTKSTFQTIVTKIAKQIGAVASNARRETDVLAKQLKLQDEELNMLWWASNGQSDSTGKLFSKLGDGERGLVAGFELAKLTIAEPGPVSVPGLLDRVGVKSTKKVTIVDAINACDMKWLHRAVVDKSNYSVPLHLAISKRLESSSTEAWVPLWAAITSLDPKAKISEARISWLFYIERLVLNQFGDE